jgi:membrane protein YqaA with SNARE-associated domain
MIDFSGFISWASLMIDEFGYLGVFLISLIGSSTVIFPLPTAFLVFAFAAVSNPFAVIVSASLGAALGEGVGYLLGIGGKEILQNKYKKFFEKGKIYFQNKKGFVFLLLLAATPLPDDVGGILAGLFYYKYWKFFLATFMGKLIMNSFLAFGGYFGINWILDIFIK